jgi:hypothetical protein
MRVGSPSLGVMDGLCPELTGAERYRLWLMLHTDEATLYGTRDPFEIIVLRECVPDPDEMVFIGLEG